MNKQMQTLLEQARQEVRSEEEIRGVAYRDFDKEVTAKFAELIVRECVDQIKICAEQIRNDEGYREDNFWPIFADIVDDVAADVQTHFGVE